MECRKPKAKSAYSMKKEGCEIEARGISYEIYAPQRSNPFKMWSRRGAGQSPRQSIAEEEDVEMQAPRATSTSSKSRLVLKNVSCRAKPWEILAIVGPSGAGKSTLLEVLAGKLEPEETSSIYVDQKPMDKAQFKKISGYVTQRDTLFPLLTVEETLTFSAQLRLRLPPSQVTARVESLIQELGLTHVAGVRVGDEKLRGISGGERRRVSIGVDVIHEPRVLILDEPTSGLDSTSALQIIDMLKIMAEVRGRTIILSIHQPGFRIVKLFNSVLLLADGGVLHQGTTDQLQSHLRSMGLQPPLHVNVVEFAIDAIEKLQLQQQQRQQQKRSSGHEGGGRKGRSGKCTLQQLLQLSKVVDEDHIAEGICDLHYDFANSRMRETAVLARRFCKIVYRTRELFALRTFQMLAAGLVLGSVFYHQDDKDRVGIEERVGLFAFILTFLLSCTTEALPIFLQEREILMKETSCGSYRVSSYVIANSLVFLPFLLILAVLFAIPLYWLVGLRRSVSSFMYFLLVVWMIFYTANSVVICFSAMVPNFIVGNSLISGVLGSFFLFSGYFISRKEMPCYWIFMHYLSLFKYPFEGFLANEFSGSEKCLQYFGGVCVMDGEDVLKEQGLEEDSRWRNLVIMACFILAYRFFTYVVLRCRCSQRSLSGALV